MIIGDTIGSVVPDSSQRQEYTVQNMGAGNVKFTYLDNGTFADDFGIIIGPNGHYTFQGQAAERAMYAISDTGNSNRVLILNPGV